MTIFIDSGCEKIEDLQYRQNLELAEINLPESVKTIGYEAFGGCKNLKKVALCDGLSEIGKYAFYGCSSLLEIEIPSTVKIIGEKAFDGCTSLKKIVVKGDIDSIGKRHIEDNTRLQRHVAGGVCDRLGFRGDCPALRRIEISCKTSSKCVEMLSDAIDYTYCNSPVMYDKYIQGVAINLALPCPDSFRNKYLRWLRNSADRVVEIFIDRDDMASMAEYEGLLLPNIHIQKMIQYASINHNVAFSAYLIEKSRENEESDLL